MITVRDMAAGDAPSASTVLCRSISELCTADHGGDPDVIARWLSNKTPDHLCRWLGHTRLLVALFDAQIAGVGGFGPSGDILLNYVSPDHRFEGVSKTLLAEMEARLANLGVTRGTLCSTGTAFRFYHDAGWTEAGPPREEQGITGYPMTKALG